MLSGYWVIGLFCLYMGILFCLALWAERRSGSGASVVNNPLVYSLSLAVYCSSWTFFGSVGVAATNGLLFLTIYLGPTLVFVFGWGILRKMVRLKASHHITSIADFISSRYEKSEPLAAIVTLIALVGTIPYVSLQLKAVLSTFALITPQAGGEPGWVGAHVGPIVVALMIVFTIIFGVRRLDPTERHEGMVMAVSAESLVKLISFLAAGVFVCYWLYDGIGDIFQSLASNPIAANLAQRQAQQVSYHTWISYLVVSACAILLLPRQFHVAVVENQKESHIRWAIWLFPLYLFAINIFVYPVALVGLLQGYSLSEADLFLLKLPLDQGNSLLALLVFIGGFSAATGMILISSMTMSTMISNHLLLPLVDWIPQLGFIERHLLGSRWLAVAAFILMGYWFERLVGKQFGLANIGMISFVAVLQLAPATLGGLFWRNASKKGATWGILVGFAIWAYTMLLPTFVLSGWLDADILSQGPLGLELLRPQSFLGLKGLDPVPHTVFWSMLFNCTFFILGSLLEEPSQESQSRAEAFVGAMSGAAIFHGSGQRAANISVAEKRRKIEMLFGRYFSPETALAMTDRAMRQVGLAGKELASISELAELYDQVERTLGGSIGIATAHRILSQSDFFSPAEAEELREVYAEILANLRARPEDLKRKIDFYQERERLIQAHSHELEEKVKELEAEMMRRRRAEAQLRESEERYRLAIDYSSDGVAVVKDGRIIFNNRKLATMFGYERGRDIANTELAYLIHPDDRKRVLDNCLQRQEGLLVPSRYDFKGLKKDGTPIYIAVSATAVNYHGDTLNLIYLRDVTQRRQAEEDIRNLSRRLIEGIEEERRRLAADLHDEFGQSMTALHMWVESLKNSLKPDQDSLKDGCDRMAQLIQTMVENLRKIASELRPDMLDHIGLIAAAQWHVNEFQQALDGLEVEFEAVGFKDRRFDPQVEIVFYRILQEALNNVAKHARATKVKVIFTYSHPQVIMMITDNGRGFVMEPPDSITTGDHRGIGLLSMKERVAAVGGTIDIRSSVGKGTVIRVALPGIPRENHIAPQKRRAAENE